MRTELIRIETPTHPLDGAYYTPDGLSKGAAMYCHGNQMNFYVCAARFLAPHYHSAGLRIPGRSIGAAMTRSVPTIAATASAALIRPSPRASRTMSLRQSIWPTKDLSNPIVIGHSNGGVLASEHVANHPETRALILLSAHAGGNRMKNPRSARNFSLAGNTDELKKHAEALVAADKPNQLMLIPEWWWVISARTYLDRLTNAPDLVENAKRIKCPGALHPRRSGADRKLSGGTIQRKLRRSVRSRDHSQLRSLLRRRRKSSGQNRDRLAETDSRMTAVSSSWHFDDWNDWNLWNNWNSLLVKSGPLAHQPAITAHGIFKAELREHVPKHRRIAGDNGYLKLGLDPLKTLDRIEHRALEINRVDVADGG